MAAALNSAEEPAGTATIRIGPIALSHPVALAPMAGVTDPPFRRLARHFGAAIAASEMTTADTRLWRTRKSSLRLDFDTEPAPRVVQIAGSEPAEMAEAAKALEQMGADIVDINMGCPAKKVCRKLAGSALLQDEKQVARILSAVVEAVSIPVTLKTRTGWDTEHKNAPRIARLAEDTGIQALAIHGRSRACRYKGQAEYDTISNVAGQIGIPLFANGDIDSPEKALEVLRLSSADGVMIGRAAQGAPWIFRDIISLMTTTNRAAPLTIDEVRDIIPQHLEDIYRFYGRQTGVRVARKHLIWYCNNFKNTDAFRYRVVRVNCASRQLGMVQDFLSSASQLVDTY